MTAAYSVGETKVESSEGVTGGWISAGDGNLNPTQPPGPMPLPRRSPPPITPGSAPKYMIWLEQPYSRLFNLGGAWAGGWVSLFARSGQSERCGQSPNDGISSWRPLSARVTPTQSFITQRRFQRVSSFRWPRKAKLISLPPLPITPGSNSDPSPWHAGLCQQCHLHSQLLKNTCAQVRSAASLPPSPHLCRQPSASLLQAFTWAVSQLGTPPSLSR